MELLIGQTAQIRATGNLTSWFKMKPDNEALGIDQSQITFGTLKHEEYYTDYFLITQSVSG